MEVADGVWFPKRWSRERWWYKDKGSTERMLESRSENVVELAEINIEMNDSLFEWKSLWYTPETVFVRTNLAGKSEKLANIEGELVPFSVARELYPSGRK